ncbi:MAG: sigma-70 family RNA polymerase sigma factor, partial [Planctomycetales bacterium]|nr:sigma-70 family RNA polymerase sigma factor [Planctomycetales bacterium]
MRGDAPYYHSVRAPVSLNRFYAEHNGNSADFSRTPGTVLLVEFGNSAIAAISRDGWPDSSLTEVIPIDRSQQTSPKFQTTRWSIVLTAGQSPGAESRQALEELAEAYWYPLYAFSRRQGSNDHDAMDLTQGFLMHLISGEALSTVAAEKGRFRSFLLAAFRNFMANQRRAAGAIRRGGQVSTLSLTTNQLHERYQREPSHEKTPELQFQRSWVQTLLARVLSRLCDG